MNVPLSDAQIDRYSRQIILNEVGVEGQKKLLKARVLLIGAGGLGRFQGCRPARLGTDQGRP